VLRRRRPKWQQIVAASPPAEELAVRTEPLTKQDLVAYLASGCKPKEKWRFAAVSSLSLKTPFISQQSILNWVFAQSGNDHCLWRIHVVLQMVVQFVFCITSVCVQCIQLTLAEHIWSIL
jgi:hypothetical protein